MATLRAASVTPCLTRPGTALPRASRPRTTRVQASFGPVYQLAQAAQNAAQAAQQVVAKTPPANPGSVDAPVWVIVVAAIGVTLALSASGFLLKPGVEASEKLQQQQQGRWRK